jgi:F0F1-type ATP synthase delta subunit
MNSQRHHLAETIAKRTMEISNTHKLAQEIAAYLLHEGQVSELESLMRDVIAYRAEHGIVEAYAESARPLTQEVVDDIRAMLHQEYPHAKKFQIDEIEQPELIGGIKVELPDEHLDLSVRARVNTFKKLTSGKEA